MPWLYYGIDEIRENNQTAVIGELAVAVRERGGDLTIPEFGRLAVRRTLFYAVRGINRTVPQMLSNFVNYRRLAGIADDAMPPRWSVDDFYAEFEREPFPTSKSFMPYLSAEWAFNMQLMLTAMCCIPVVVDGKWRWKFMNVPGGYDKCLYDQTI